MAIIVSTNAYCSINSVNLSDHMVSLRINDGQETRDVTAHGKVNRVYLPGLANVWAEVEYFNDHATGSVEPTLRALIGTTSTGTQFLGREFNTARSSSNPEYQFMAIPDGDLLVVDAIYDQPEKIKVKLVPTGSLTVATSSS